MQRGVYLFQAEQIVTSIAPGSKDDIVPIQAVKR